MNEALFNSVRTFQDESKRIRQSGRLFFFVLLAASPGFCIVSTTLHTIKLGTRDLLRCKIDELENGRLNWTEIQAVSEYNGPNMECYIYDYDYSKFPNMTFEETKKARNQTKVKKKLCTKFVIRKEEKNFPQSFPQEFADYCESLKYDLLYDAGALISYILSCIFLVPLADLMGRKRIFTLGIRLAYVAVFLKFMSMYFVRDILGEIMMNIAYPPLKFTTQAIIFEISEDKLRPLTFILTYVGLHIPLASIPFLPRVYWKCLQLLTCSVVLLLPIPEWYLPESPLWIMSTRRPVTARFYAKTMNDPIEHNALLVNIKNRTVTLSDLRALFKEFRKINQGKIILCITIAVCTGYISFYTYSKPKLMSVYFEEGWVGLLNYWGGIIALLLVLPAAFWTNRTTMVVAVMFFINGVFFCLLLKNYFSVARQPFTFELLATSLEITAVVQKTFYEYYLAKYFPTSHRCTCIGFYGASIKLGLLFFIGIQQISFTASNTIAGAVCLTGCILAVFMKNLDSVIPLAFQFEDMQLNADR